MKSLMALVLIVATYTMLFGQISPFHKLREQTLPFKVTQSSVDRLGELYLSGEGQLIKFSTDGHPLYTRQQKYEEQIQLIEAWNPLRVWIHHKNKNGHLIELLDQKLLNLQEPIQIDPSFAVNPKLIAPGINNNSYWILDEDHTLKMINIEKNIVEWESEPIAPLDHPGFKYFRIYQNFLILQSNNQEIFILNRLGKIIKKLNTKSKTSFGVLGEDIYYLEDQSLIFQNIYNEIKQEVTLPSGIEVAIATDERLMLIRGKILDIYRFQPFK